MKRNKGFTLIELLAVIVILAIIALIATPAIINIIENARKKAFEDTSYGVLEGLKLSYVERTAQGTTSKEQIFDFTKKDNGLKLSGEAPKYGIAKIDGNGKISFALADEDKKWCVKKDADSEKISIVEYNPNTCLLYDSGSGEIINSPSSFKTDSWSTIIAAVRNNNTGVYNVGDTKEIDMGELGVHIVRIANKEIAPECKNEGFSQTACGFVIEFEDQVTGHNISSVSEEYPDGTSIGGWPATEMRSYLQNELYKTLPEELKKGIIDTLVVSSRNKNESSNFTSVDKLYLLSTKEIYGEAHQYDTLVNETRQLDYYKKIGVSLENVDGSYKKYNGAYRFYWLRSVANNYNNGFYICYLGGPTGASVNSVGGVSPAFRIG